MFGGPVPAPAFPWEATGIMALWLPGTMTSGPMSTPMSVNGYQTVEALIEVALY
jgi:hypothetical protein